MFHSHIFGVEEHIVDVEDKIVWLPIVFLPPKQQQFYVPKLNAMKKVSTLTVLAALLLLGACEKESRNVETSQPSPNRVVVIPSDGKTASTTILMSEIGHDEKICPGCVLYDGEMIHLDCMGFGNYCRLAAAVQLQQVGTAVTATTTDTFDLTSEDFFLMPDRSLDYVDEKGSHIFLNIPEQMVYRDTATLQFTFTGLFFSEIAAYSNN